jgi:predicted RNA-binding protein with PUA-like domain
VRNYAARNNIRDRIKPGHLCFYYHASAGARTGVAGIVEVARPPFPDPDAADPAHPFYDAAHTAAAPRWYNLALRAVRPLRRLVPLTELRRRGGEPGSPLGGMALLRISRLSVQPVKKGGERVASGQSKALKSLQ